MSVMKNCLKKARILVIDDETEMCETLSEILTQEGYEVSTALSGEKALRLLQSEFFDLILCDIFMPDLGGFALLSRIPAGTPVVMMTAFASVETARKAFKVGVRDYLVKPFKTSELLLILKQTICEHQTGKDRGTRSKDFLTQNDRLRRLLNEAAKFASTDVPILIEGESGVGKELLANFIQANSGRAEAPYLKINCAAIPESLLESELFGHEKGAFTGAFEKKIGIFEYSDGGTLLLDEIGDMPLYLQAKILRVLQEFKFMRLGGKVEMSSNVRIIASTNRNLSELLANGEFREDLFHRINGVRFQIPPLRDRPEDVQFLSDFFAKKFSDKYELPFRGIAELAVQALLGYRWPGNIRELRHVMERAVILADGARIDMNHLPEVLHYDTAYESQSDLEEDKVEFELLSLEKRKANHLRDLIVTTLKAADGNRSEAAERLNVSRKTLYNWMKRLEIHSDFI